MSAQSQRLALSAEDVALRDKIIQIVLESDIQSAHTASDPEAAAREDAEETATRILAMIDTTKAPTGIVDKASCPACVKGFENHEYACTKEAGCAALARAEAAPVESSLEQRGG